MERLTFLLRLKKDLYKLGEMDFISSRKEGLAWCLFSSSSLNVFGFFCILYILYVCWPRVKCTGCVLLSPPCPHPFLRALELSL